MIQTQLLRLDPPYQIIAAGGQVGIQVATLIVTEEKKTSGSYSIDTHSHPVVSYGLKQGLMEEFNYGGYYPDDVENRKIRLQPEGAVWNKVDVCDIRVLGLAGAKNSPIPLDTFIYMVPSSVHYNPETRTYVKYWDDKSITKMYELLFGFSRVGLRCEKKEWQNQNLNVERVQMYLKLDTSDSNEPMVDVVLKEAEPYDPLSVEIGFRVKLFNGISTDACKNIIVNAYRAISEHFIAGRIYEKFVCFINPQDDILNDDLRELTEQLNKTLYLE